MGSSTSFDLFKAKPKLALGILVLYAVLANVLGLAHFSENLAWWEDDNALYYANRFLQRTTYAGDVWHNAFQDVYPYLSAAFWLPVLLAKSLKLVPLWTVFTLTALKPLMLAGAGAFVAFSWTRSALVAVAAGIALDASQLFRHNLAAFGYWKHMPYQSDLAIALVLFAMGFALRGRWTKAHAIVWGCALLHPSMGLMSLSVLWGTRILTSDLAGPGRWTQLCLSAATVLSAVIPARIAVGQVPAAFRGTARLVYSELEKTHGALWNFSDGVWWKLLAVAVAWTAMLALVTSKNSETAPRRLRALAGMLWLLVLAGLAAKGLCELSLANGDRFLSLFLPFHQLLLPRASTFLIQLAFLVGFARLAEDLRDRPGAASYLVLACASAVVFRGDSIAHSIVIPCVAFAAMTLPTFRGQCVLAIATTLYAALVDTPMHGFLPLAMACVAALTAVPHFRPRHYSNLIPWLLCAIASLSGLRDSQQFDALDRSKKAAWLATALWAKSNLPSGVSVYTMAVEKNETAPSGWRTFSERGAVPLLSPPVSMVYTPDVRFNLTWDRRRDYLDSRHANEKGPARLSALSVDDLAWLRESDGVRYAVGWRDLPIPATRIYANAYFALYELPTRHSPTTEVVRQSVKVRGSSRFIAGHTPDVAMKSPLAEGYVAAEGQQHKPDWFELDLGTPRDVTGVDVFWYDDHRVGRQFQLEIRDANGQPVGQCARTSNSERVVGCSFAALSARFVRLSVDEATTDNRLLLRHLAIFAKSGGKP